MHKRRYRHSLPPRACSAPPACRRTGREQEGAEAHEQAVLDLKARVRRACGNGFDVSGYGGVGGQEGRVAVHALGLRSRQAAAGSGPLEAAEEEDENFDSFEVASDDEHDNAGQQARQHRSGPGQRTGNREEAAGSAYRLVNMRRQRNLEARFNDRAPGAVVRANRFVQHVDPFFLHHHGAHFEREQLMFDTTLHSFTVTSDNLRNCLHSEVHTQDGFGTPDREFTRDPFQACLGLPRAWRRWLVAFPGTLTRQDLAHHNAAHTQRRETGPRTHAAEGSTGGETHGQDAARPQEEPVRLPARRAGAHAHGPGRGNARDDPDALQGRVGGERPTLVPVRQEPDDERPFAGLPMWEAIWGEAAGPRHQRPGHASSANAHSDSDGAAGGGSGAARASEWLVAFLEKARSVPLREACKGMLGDDVGPRVADYVGSLMPSDREFGSDIDVEEVPNGESVKGPRRFMRVPLVGEGRAGIMIDGDALISTPGHSSRHSSTDHSDSERAATITDLTGQHEGWLNVLDGRAFSGLA